MIKKFLKSAKGNGYQARAMRSTGYVLLSFGGENVLRLASNVILARLLFPEAFGLMALVQVVIAGAAMFSDLGFRGAIVQDPRGDDPAFLNTAWTLQILRGGLLTIIVLALAGPAARFYEEPMLGELLMLAAFVPLIGSFESTRSLAADRTLEIERLTVLTLGTQFAGVVATVGLAWWLGTVWALGVGLLVAPVLKAVLSHVVLTGHANRLQLEKEALWSLLSYGGFIFVASVAGFFAMHGDRAVLGKFVDLDDLAIYNIAMLLALVPRKLSMGVAGRVIFPLYARRPPAESASNRLKINRARRLVTGPLLILAALFGIFGNDLIRLLYDDRYAAAGPYLVLIALAAIPETIVQTYLRLPLASGHSGRFALFQIATAVARLGSLLLLVPTMGLLGAVITFPLVVFLLYPFLLLQIRRYQSWDPLHDILALLAWVLLSVGVLWWNADVVRPLFEAAGITYIL